MYRRHWAFATAILTTSGLSDRSCSGVGKRAPRPHRRDLTAEVAHMHVAWTYHVTVMRGPSNSNVVCGILASKGVTLRFVFNFPTPIFVRGGSPKFAPVEVAHRYDVGGSAWDSLCMGLMKLVRRSFLNKRIFKNLSRYFIQLRWLRARAAKRILISGAPDPCTRTPTPLHPCTPTPLHPYTPAPLHPYTPTLQPLHNPKP